MDEFNASKIGSNLIAVSNFYTRSSSSSDEKSNMKGGMDAPSGGGMQGGNRQGGGMPYGGKQ